MKPFKIIENEGFLKLIKFFAPEYHVPDRTFFSK